MVLYLHGYRRKENVVFLDCFPCVFPRAHTFLFSSTDALKGRVCGGLEYNAVFVEIYQLERFSGDFAKLLFQTVNARQLIVVAFLYL
jgi:hypothetical protein